MQSKRAFSLMELMVGTLIGTILIAGMLSFTSRAAYIFRGTQDIVQNRNHVKRVLMVIGRDLMEIGVKANADGIINEISATTFYIELGTANGFSTLSYWVPTNTFDELASADENIALAFQQVSFQVVTMTDPINPDSGRVTNVLQRQEGVDGAWVPYLLDVTEFNIEFLDANDTWSTSYPTDETSRKNVYGDLDSLRITVSTETDTQTGVSANSNGADEDDTVMQSIKEIVLIRNRSEI